MTISGRPAVALLLILAGAAACASPTVPTAPATSPPLATPTAAVGPTGSAGAAVAATPSPEGPAATPATPSPAPTVAPKATRSPPAAPSPTPSRAPTPADFWAVVASGITAAKRLELDIIRPDAATMRFEVRASATVIDGVIGLVCIGGKAYDGQSAFTAIPGRWTCGAPALVAGFRHIGQPIDAWGAAIPSDQSRREAVTVRGDTWTWSYRATSPYLGGAVTATVVLDRSSRRIASAHRQDPTGATRYAFHYGASFPPLVVPR